MILAFDIGNSNIVMGGVTNGVTDFISRLTTERTRTADEYAVILELNARQKGVDLRRAEGAIIASVVPRLTSVFSEAIKTATGLAPLVLGPKVKTGLNIRIDDPQNLGGDFVASAVAALATYPLPCITIDMSMATAIGVLDKSGAYIGGMIAPGVAASLEALTRGASQLHSVSLDAPARAICKTTEASMRSGVIYGFSSMLDGLIARIEEELGSPATVVATGDWAERVVPYCRREGIISDPDLVMRGLWMIYRKNRK